MKAIVTLSAFALLLGHAAFAQPEAITSYTPGHLVGFASGGAGYSFMPKTSIEITALGMGGDVTNSPYQLGLYNASGGLLATAVVNSTDSQYNQSYYQSITPIVLSAFSTNYIQAIGLDNGNIWVGSIVGVDGGGSFAVNSDLNYIAGAANFVGGIPSTQNAGDLFAGANFEFTSVPEPSASCLGLAGLLGLIASKWRVSQFTDPRNRRNLD